MTHLTESNQNSTDKNHANFEHFAESETARIEHAIKEAQVELKAYQVISSLYGHIERGEVSYVHGNQNDFGESSAQSADTKLFSLPDGATVSVIRHTQDSYASLEIGHNIAREVDSSSTAGTQYKPDFRVYVWPDVAYETVRAVEFGAEPDSPKISTDMNLPTRAVHDLADSFIGLVPSTEQ